MHVYIAAYLALISVIAIVLTVYDKRAALKGRWRVKESTLIIISILGGAVAMLATMRLARHKTKHAKFMVGIPVIVILQAAAIGALLWRKYF